MTTPLSSLIDEISGVQVLVLGDVVLETYVRGTTGRVAQEAPVPVVGVAEREFVPGGAANVAVNVKALGGHPRLLAVIGDDGDGAQLRNSLGQRGVGVTDLVSEPGRRTPTRTRVVADDQLVVRLDEGSASPVRPAAESALLESLRSISGSVDAAIVTDRGLGTMTPGIVQALADLRAGTPRLVVVDAKNPAAYRGSGVTAMSLSYERAANLLGLAPAMSDEERASQLTPAAGRLLDATEAELVSVTLDQDGALVFERNRPPYHADGWATGGRRGRVTGAGDAFMAAFAMGLAAKAGAAQAGELAWAAATVVASKEGPAACSAFDLKEFVAADQKSMPLDRLLARLDYYRRQGKRIVFTDGCFDVVHRGHITFLNRAKGLGDVLVVGLNSDKSVARLKGSGRPIIPLEDRIEILTAVSSVDHVIPFNEDAPLKLIRAIRPHVFVKGGDYTREMLPEASVVEELGGAVQLLPIVDDRSSSGVIDRVRRAGDRTPEGIRAAP
ncbi:MAG TPA: D-glycero-beta-D-manno-heptose 1-phosphate adenylyltransferase [Actinomycetota bacterium]